MSTKRTDRPDYDTIIIGGGQAGVPLAEALAEDGRRVALVERARLGGSCVNFGCTPTKAVIASARLAHQARRAAEYGLHIPSIEVNFPAVLDRARKIAAESREGLEKKFDGTDNPRLLRGQARLDGRDDGKSFRVVIGGRAHTARQIVLNTGTRSLIPPVDGLDEVKFIDAGNWLDQEELPAHLAILGGGYIALEMSQFYRRMGSRVTIVESGGRVAAREDEEISEALQKALEAEGVEFRLKSKAIAVEARGGKDLAVTIEEGGGSGAAKKVTRVVEATHLFVATGRRPNTDDLGLETLGVRVDEEGVVEADEQLRTSVEGVWAAGDVRGGPQFTHTSWDDYRVLESQMIGDGSRTTAKRIVPYAIFTDPELGRVGMTEKEARESGKKIKVNCYEMKKNGKAREVGESGGFIKVIVDEASDKILGATVFAFDGAELVHLYADLMNADAPFTVMRDAVHIHPTFAEAAQSALKKIKAEG